MAEDRNILGKLALGHDPNEGATAAQIAAAERYDGTVGQYNKELRQATDAMNAYDNASRSTWETIDQGGKDVAKGVVNTVGGIATAGGLLLDTVAGTNTAEAITGGLNKFNEFADNDGDFVRQANTKVNQAKSQEIARINSEKYGDTARGALSNFTDTLLNSSGEDVFQTIGEGVGSILGIAGTGGVGGVVGKGGTKIAGKVANKLAGKKAVTEAEKAVAKEAVKKTTSSAVGKVEKAVEASTNPSMLARFGGSKELATMALIGGMEGGSQAGEFITKVMDTPYETLYETSKQFRDLIAQGYTEQEARQAVAKSGALTVLAEVGATAALMGKVVSKFESAPMKMFSGKAALGNMAREAVEETSQSVSGALLTNYNVQDKVDKNQEIYDDVGQQGAMGLIGGVGSAGALQAPSLGVSAVKNTAKGAIKTGKYAIGKFKGDEEGNTASNTAVMGTDAKGLPKQDPKLKNKIQNSVTSAESVDDVIKGLKEEDITPFIRSKAEYTAMAKNKDDPAEVEKVAKLSVLADMISLDMDVNDITKLTEDVLDEQDIASLSSTSTDGKVSPIEVILVAMEKLNSIEEPSPEDMAKYEKLEDAFADMLKERVVPYANLFGKFDPEDIIDTSTPEGMNLSTKLSAFTIAATADGTEPIYQAMYHSIVNSNTRKQQRIKDNPQEYLNNFDIAEVLGNQEMSPQAIQETISNIDTAIQQLESVDFEEGSTTSQEIEKYKALRDILSIYADTQSDVENQIFNNHSLLDEEGNSRKIGRNPSIREFLTDMYYSAQEGDTKAVKESMRDLGKFVVHLRNKANAVNESAEGFKESRQGIDGTPTPSKYKATKYSVLDPETREFTKKGNIGIRLDNKKNVMLARDIIQNANDATNIFNLAQKAFGISDSKILDDIIPSPRLTSAEGYKDLSPRSFKNKPTKKTTNKSNSTDTSNTTTTDSNNTTATSTPKTTSKVNNKGVIEDTNSLSNGLSTVSFKTYDEAIADYSALDPSERPAYLAKHKTILNRIHRKDRKKASEAIQAMADYDMAQNPSEASASNLSNATLRLAKTDNRTPMQEQNYQVLKEQYIKAFNKDPETGLAINKESAKDTSVENTDSIESTESTKVEDPEVVNTKEDTTETTETTTTTEDTPTAESTETESKTETVNKEEPKAEVKEDSKEDLKEDLKEEETIEDSNVDEDYYDDMEGFSIALYDDNSSELNVSEMLADVEEAYSEIENETKQVIEDNPSSEPLEVLALLDYSFKPVNAMDHAVKLFMGDKAFLLPRLLDNPDSKVWKKAVKEIFGNLFTDLGLENVDFPSLFNTKDKKGNTYFDMAEYIKFARRFSAMAQAAKELGIIERGKTVKDIDITDGSLGAYATIKALTSALKGDARKSFIQRINTLTAKSKSAVNRNLIGHIDENYVDITRNTLIEGFDFNVKGISPATFSKSPYKALWSLISNMTATDNRTKDKLVDENGLIDGVAQDLNKYKAFTDYILKNMKERSKGLASGILNKKVLTTGDRTIFNVVQDNLFFREGYRVPYNYLWDTKTINAFEHNGDTYTISERIVEAYTMAILDTLMEQTTRVTDENLVDTRSEGVVKEAVESSQGRRNSEEVKDGIPVNTFTRNVVAKANTILGIKENPNSPEGITKGTSYAIAADMIDLMTTIPIDMKTNEKGEALTPVIEKKNTSRVHSKFQKGYSIPKGIREVTVTFKDGSYTNLPVINGNITGDVTSNESIVSTSYFDESTGNLVTLPQKAIKYNRAETLVGYKLPDNGFVKGKQFKGFQRVGANLFTDSSKKSAEPNLTTKPVKVSTRDIVRNSKELHYTEDDVELINTLNSIPNTVNDTMVDQYTTGDVIELAEWLNEGIAESAKSEFTNGNIHKARSDSSKFNMIVNSIRFLKETRNKANDLKKQGKPANFYFRYNKGGENRVHASGAMNSQTNKIVREALSANEATIDISKDGYSRDTYLTGIAQGLGLKVNNKSRTENAEKVTEFLSNFPKSLEAIKANLRDGVSVFNKKTLDTIKQENANNESKGIGSIDRSMVALHNLIDYARFTDASVEDLKNFKTWVYLEIDGVTKGVGDSMQIFSTSPLATSNAVDKTGTINSDDLEEYDRRVYDPNNPDIYATGADNYKNLVGNSFKDGIKFFKNIIGAIRPSKGEGAVTKSVLSLNDMKPNNRYGGAKDAVFGSVAHLFEIFDIGVEVQPNGDLVISRGFAKKPVMVINYGSGKASVAKSVMSMLQSMAVERLDEIAKKSNRNSKGSKISEEKMLQIFFKNNASLSENKRNLADMYVALDVIKKSKHTVNKKGFKVPDKVRGFGYVMEYGGMSDVFNQKGLKELYDNITSYAETYDAGIFSFDGNDVYLDGLVEALGEPLSIAVKDISPLTSENMTSTATVNNATSQIIRRIYEKRLEKKINKVYAENPERIKKNGLTHNEYMEVVNSIREDLGLISSGSVRIDVFGEGQADLIELQEGTGYTTKGYTDPKSYKRMLERAVVDILGVSSSPLTTIGTEGEMLRLFTKIAPKPLVDAVVTIHDGYNIALKPFFADKLSLLMNLAAAHSWENIDPFKSANDVHTKAVKELEKLNIDLEEVLTAKDPSSKDSGMPAEMIMKNYRTALDSVQMALSDNGKRKSPLENGIITNAMNGADVPVRITKDGKTNVIPVLEAIYVAEHLGVDLDVRSMALSEAVEPVSYDLETLGQKIKDGSFKKEAIAKYNEGKLSIKEFESKPKERGVSEEKGTPTAIGNAANNADDSGLSVTELAIKNAKPVSKNAILNGYIMAGYKGIKSNITRAKARAIKSLLEKGIFDNITVKELDDISNNKDTDLTVNGLFDANTNTVYVRKGLKGTKKGADAIYHELTHGATFKMINDAVLGNLDSYPANSKKVLTNLVDALKGSLDAIASMDKEGLPDNFKKFISMYAGKSTSEMTPSEIVLGISELLAHGTTIEAFREHINKAKVDADTKSKFKAIKKLMDTVTKFKQALFKIMGIKSIEEINTLADDLVFSKETLTEIAENYYNNNDINPDDDPTPPTPKKPKPKAKTKAGKKIQESFDFLESVDFEGKSEAIQQRNQTFREKILETKMGLFKDIGLLDSQDDVIEATSLAYAIEYSEKTDPVLYSRIAEAYEDLIKEMKPSDFITTSQPSQADLNKAQAIYNIVKDIPNSMEEGAVALFASLAYKSDTISSILNRVNNDPSKLNTRTLFKNPKEYFNSLIEKSIESIYDRSLEAFNKEGTSDTHLKALITKLDALHNKDNTLFDKVTNYGNNKLNASNDYVVKKLTEWSTKAFKATDNLRRSSNKAVKALGYAAMLPTLFYADREVTNTILDSTMKIMSIEGMPRFFRELVSDIVGRTDFTGDVYDMIKTVKSKVQLLRQSYREQVPNVLKGYFSKQLTSEELTAITEGVLQTDIQSLLSDNSYSDVLSLVSSDTARARKIKDLEASIMSNVGRRLGNLMLDKSKELAKFMITRESSFNLLRNADQIANLTGTGIGVSVNISEGMTLKQLTQEIDQLVSLYALNELPSTTRDTISSLGKYETEGLKKTLEYNKGIVSADISSKYANDFSKDNRLKGYMPLENTSKNTIVDVPKDSIRTYEKRGYTVLEYDPFGNAYMYIDVRVNGIFHQGIVQTVRPSVGGADASSGMLTGMSYGKLITDKNMMNKISSGIAGKLEGYENYLPVYRNAGETVPFGYQKIPSRDVAPLVNYDTDFSKVLANFTGRKVEESLAVASNKELVNKLNEMYVDSSMESRKRDFIDIMDTKALDKDPVLKDAARLIPPQMRAFIIKNNGGKLYIRRDMLNDVMGYRMALVSDMWTGNSRIHKAIRDNFSGAMNMLLGKNAMKWLTKTQLGIQSLVADARDVIVIRSIVVPAINLASTMAQTILRGVSPLKASKSMFQKLREINRYVELRRRITKLESERIANYNNKEELSNITSRINFLESSIKKLTIYPLIEAGEFTSIVDSTIDNTTESLTEGGLINYVEGKINKLPKGLSTIAKYSIISSDTVLYDALKKLTDYGDFIGKSIVYDHYISKGKDPKEVMSIIREEFVNYDKLQGRTRHTIENLGLGWFWNWKIRATKTFFSIMKHNPLNALIMNFSPLSGVGTPIDESLVNRIFGDKSLTGSLGISQGINAWTNLPIGYAFK